MQFLTAKHTDIGTKKKTNQDSILLLQAENDDRGILLAAVCDGMGGLAKGELASATMVRMLEAWFSERLPLLLVRGFAPEDLWEDWTTLVTHTNQTLAKYAREHHTSLGTTAAVLLLLDQYYYVMNVGDSRVYRISDSIYQLTKDQTVVQREIDAGRMTYEESLRNPDRSVLLQCIGASPEVVPDFLSGIADKDDVFMLCSDGFRHVISAGEFFETLHPSRMTDPNIMEKRLQELTSLNIQRNEDDNISAALVRLKEEQ